MSGIENALREVKIGRSPSVTNLTVKTPSSSEQAHSQIATPSAFEGASSFTSQAIQASQAAGKSLEKIRGSADVADALISLQTLASASGGVGIKQPMRLGRTEVTRKPPEIELLPAQFVLSLLQEFKHKPCALFLAYAFRDHRQLERLCQQIYFPTDSVSLPSLTLMNGMLYYLITELLFNDDIGSFTSYDLKALRDQAEQNFHLGVETYEIFASPSLESAKVLMLAVSHPFYLKLCVTR